MNLNDIELPIKNEMNDFNNLKTLERNKKVIVASAPEIRNNSRARSAKLRIAIKKNDN